MKAKMLNLELAGPHHWCDLCDDLMDGSVKVEQLVNVRRLYMSAPGEHLPLDGIDLVDWLEEQYSCRDQCTTDDPDAIYNLSEVWYCGVCQVKFKEADDAADCCR